MPSFKIVIVGGGFAGLATAHALLKACSEHPTLDLDIKVYERRTDESGYQKYPIHMAPDGRLALRHILTSTELEDLLSKSLRGIDHDGMYIVSAQFQRLYFYGQNESRGEAPRFVQRWVLKEALEQGVTVDKGKVVMSVADLDTVRPKLVMDDGTQIEADLVVGADGVGSLVRSSISPRHSRFPLLPYIVVRLKLHPALCDLPLPDKTGNTRIFGGKDYSILLAYFQGTPLPIPSPEDEMTASSPAARAELSFSDALSPANTVLAAALNQPTPEYIYAGVTVRSFAGWEDLTAEAWQDRIVTLLRADKAHPALIKAFAEAMIDGTAGARQIVSCDAEDPVPFCPGGRVVVVGDAAHAMAPHAGAGGSSALMDAYQLVEAILRSSELGGKGKPLSVELETFHHAMLGRAAVHVRESKWRLEQSMRSGWFATTWGNTLLRLADWVWPVTNWVIKRTRGVSTDSLVNTKND